MSIINKSVSMYSAPLQGNVPRRLATEPPKPVRSYSVPAPKSPSAEEQKNDTAESFEKLPLCLFKDANVVRYICCSCQQVPLHASSCNHGHIFCQDCLKQLVDQKMACPVDQQMLVNIFESNPVVDNFIAEEVIFCIHSRAAGHGEGQYVETPGANGNSNSNNDNGTPGESESEPKQEEKCPWQGQVKLLTQHLETCKFKPLNCPFSLVGCGKRVRFINKTINAPALKQHFEQEIIQHQLLLLQEVRELKTEVTRLKSLLGKGAPGADLLQQDEFKFDNAASAVLNIDVSQNAIIGVGCNEKGEMGNDTDDNVINLRKLEWTEHKSIEKIFNSGYKTFTFCTQLQDIYQTGCNDYGGLGIGNEDDQWTALLHSGFQKLSLKIRSVSRSISAFHMFFITTTGAIYASGANEQGQLGLGDEKNRSTITEVAALRDKQITDIACGAEHSLFLSQTGLVYSCGSNEETLLGYATKSQLVLTPNQITLTDNNSSNNQPISIMQICCGRSHSYLLDTNGMIWAFGSNSRGQLGMKKKESAGQKAPLKIRFFEQQKCKIMTCAAGNDHGCALDMNGFVYVWGRGDEGQIGNGKKADKYMPVKLDFFDKKKVINIMCGCHHTVVLTDKQRVFCWGNNRYNQCNDEYQDKFDTEHRPVRKPKELFKSGQIIAILAGSYQTLLLINNALQQ